MESARTAIIAVVTASILSGGCASSSHQFQQLPCEIRVIHVESNRANYPLPLFVDSGPELKEKIAPGMIEAIAVIARAVSDCFKWGFDAAKYQSRWAIQFGFISVDIVQIRWGEQKEPVQAAMAWEANKVFMDEHLPMLHQAGVVTAEEMATATSCARLIGWSKTMGGTAR